MNFAVQILHETKFIRFYQQGQREFGVSSLPLKQTPISILQEFSKKYSMELVNSMVENYFLN